MPKPVLSDSLFNADDVATAVLAEANLQIANSDLGVSDISSSFTYTSGFTVNQDHAMYFNGFIFYSAYIIHYNGSPSNGAKIADITNANYRPSASYNFPAIGFQGDVGSSVEVTSSGEIKIHNPTNVSSSNYYITLNGFWNANY